MLDMEKQKGLNLKDIISKWIELQDTINAFYDSTKSGKTLEKGA